jgi:hypothetical protein
MYRWLEAHEDIGEERGKLDDAEGKNKKKHGRQLDAVWNAAWRQYLKARIARQKIEEPEYSSEEENNTKTQRRVRRIATGKDFDDMSNIEKWNGDELPKRATRCYYRGVFGAGCCATRGCDWCAT